LDPPWGSWSADVKMRLFLGPLVSLLSRALLTSGFSGAASRLLRHESELALLANDVSKIRCNAHRVRNTLICGRAGRELHGGESREETLVGAHALTTRLR